MNDIAQLHRMSLGSGFRAYSLRGGERAEPIDPFLGVDHAWMSASTFPPHPHAGFSAVSYLFLDSETQKTFAELSAEEKLARSHRGRALRELLNWLASQSAPHAHGAGRSG